MGKKKANFGEVLRAIRLERGMTQTEVAERVRNRRIKTLSEPHYRRIEGNFTVPSVILAMEICSVLETDIYEVWG